MPQSTSADVIAQICNYLSSNQNEAAIDLAQKEVPWIPKKLSKRTYSKSSATRIFLRDGFIDRYFKSRLVYPGALLLLGSLLPNEFPMHPTWKVSESHEIFWDLWPAVDHVIPLSRGGSGADDNLVSTSTLHNNAKGHWRPEELGWKLYPPGNLKEWDGLLSWFVRYVDQYPGVIEGSNIRNWYQVAKRVGS